VQDCLTGFSEQGASSKLPARNDFGLLRSFWPGVPAPETCEAAAEALQQHAGCGAAAAKQQPLLQCWNLLPLPVGHLPGL
jgi:hypothetical protein